MAKHNETGAKGEAVAAEYLRAKGYEILATNWRSGRKELDILAANDVELIVVEVKTRSGLGYGFPEEAIIPSKQALLRAAASEYLEQNERFTQVSFDVIGIILKDGIVEELLHLEDAFI